MSNNQEDTVVFPIPEDAKVLTHEFLSKLNEKTLKSLLSWHAFCMMPTDIPPHHATIITQTLGDDAQHWKPPVKRAVRAYISWLGSQKEQVPVYMAQDSARTNGHETLYTEETLVVKAKVDIVVPASRVPLPETFYPKSKDAHSMRPGSDILAASLGAASRWTGKIATITLPADTLTKFSFKHLDPNGVQDLLGEIPRSPKDTGKKGRAWAYELMALFQNMDRTLYYEFQSNWIRSVFKLPAPGPGLKSADAINKNFKIITIATKYYYVFTFLEPALLRGLSAGLDASLKNVAEVYESINSFNSVRQGEYSGIGMLAGSTGSWGLVSASTARCEQFTSLILGMEKPRVVISGLPPADVEWIRFSVKHHMQDTKVYELVTVDKTDEKNFRTSTTLNSLFIVAGGLHIATNVPAIKSGQLRSYSEDLVIEKTWLPTTRVLGQEIPGTVTVYHAAMLPPLELGKVKLYALVEPWNSVFFSSHTDLIFDGILKTEKGFQRSKLEIKPLTSLLVYEKVTQAMNRVISNWAVPPVTKSIRLSGLMRPVPIKKNRKTVCGYAANADDYVIEYFDDEDDDADEVKEPGDAGGTGEAVVKKAGTEVTNRPNEKKEMEVVIAKDDEYN